MVRTKSTIMSDPMMMDHVSITVPDVDKAIKFYSKALGLKVLRVSVLTPEPGVTYKNAYMYSGTFLLEIITATKSATPMRRPKNLQDSMRGSIGIMHLGMRVKNLESAIRKLKAAGAKTISEPFQISKKSANIVYAAPRVDPRIKYARRPGEKPWRNAVFADPNGIIVELVER